MFISFEGMEGSGKSTLLQRLCEDLAGKGLPFLRTQEPGGSELGRMLRALLLDTRQDIVPESELFLYLADRVQHVQQVIRPALAEGRLVLSDRYADSTIVYQGYGRGLPVERLDELNRIATGGLWPDLTILFDLEPAVGLARARSRNTGCGTEVTEGRFEAETMAFHERVREGYLVRAQLFPERFRIIDAGLSPERVYARVAAMLKPFVPLG